MESRFIVISINSDNLQFFHKNNVVVIDVKSI